MLRGPPSRIHLTLQDLHNLDRCIASKAPARLPRKTSCRLHLSSGPGRVAFTSIVPADRNIGRTLSDSSSSQATLHNVESDFGEEGPPAIWNSDDDGKGQSRILTDDCAVEGIQSPLITESPSLPSESLVTLYASLSAQQVDILPENLVVKQSTVTALLSPTVSNDTWSNPPETTSAPKKVLLMSGAVLVSDLKCPEDDLKSQWEPSAFSPARVRRRKGRGYNFSHTRGGVGDRRGHQTQMTVTHPSTALELDVYSESTTGPNLNPGAPVFVPHIHRGLATPCPPRNESRPAHVDQAHIEGSLDIAGSVRPVSMSEQNVTRWRKSPGGADNARPVAETRPQPIDGLNSLRERRRRNRNVRSPPAAAPYLDRYPMLLPPSRTDLTRPYAALPSINAGMPQVVKELPKSLVNDQEPKQATLRVARLLPSASDDETTLPASALHVEGPSISTSSRSSPNLCRPPSARPCIHARGSSLSWRRSSSSYANLDPTSAGINFIDGCISYRNSSNGGLDVAEELLQMRNSPLDELSERLSRYAAVRPLHVEKRSPGNVRPGVQLLAGDLFKFDASPSSLQSRTPRCEPSVGFADRHLSKAAETTALTDNKSQVVHPSSDGLPSTLPSSSPQVSAGPQAGNGVEIQSRFPLVDGCSRRSHVASHSPQKANESVRPVATPRLAVYDDTNPAHTQPDTPADLWSVRGSRAASFLGRSIPTSSEVASGKFAERHPHRRTYPSASLPHYPGRWQVMATVRADSNAVESEPAHAQQSRAAGNSQYRRNDVNEMENGVEAHHDQLEQDRRRWIARHEEGNLDITPPRMGRFERYLF